MNGNYSILKRICDAGEVLRPARQQLGPDGRLDLTQNMQIWNRALSELDCIQLWPDGAPGFDDRDPMQRQPNIVFIPAQGAEEPRGTVLVAHGV